MSIEGSSRPKRGRDGEGEVSLPKRAKIDVDGLIRSVHVIASMRQISLRNHPDLGGLVYKLATHTAEFSSEQRQQILQDITSIKQHVQGDRNEKQKLFREINHLEVSLKSRTKRAREEDIEEMPLPKRERLDPLKEIHNRVKEYLEGAADISDVLEELFKDPSNRGLVNAKAIYVKELVEKEKTDEGYLSKVQRFASSLFLGRPWIGDPETLALVAGLLLEAPEQVEIGRSYNFTQTPISIVHYYPLNLFTFLNHYCTSAILLYEPQYKGKRAVFFDVINATKQKVLRNSAISEVMARAFPVHVVFDLPLQERSELMHQITPLLRGMHHSYFGDFLKIAMETSSKERRLLLNQLAQLIPLMQLSSHSGDPFFAKLAAIAKEERFEVLSQATQFLLGDSSLAGLEFVETSDSIRYFVREVLDTVTAIQQGQREEVVSLTRSLFKGDVHCSDRIAILKIVCGLPEDQRANVVAHARPWVAVAGGVDDRKIEAFFTKLIDTPEDQRAHLIARKAEALRPFEHIADFKRLIFEIFNVSNNALPSIVNQALSLARGLTQIVEIEEVLSFCCHAGREHLTLLENTIQGILPQLQDNMSSHERIRLALQALQERLEEDFGDDRAYILNINRTALRESPEKLLHSLCEQFKGSICRRLSVRFLDEPGVDFGGLGREFVSEICAGIKDKLGFKECENGLYRPELKRGRHGVPQGLSEDDRVTLQDLGKLFMFCLNAAEDYPIGMLFDQSVFEALTRFDALPPNGFEELFSIYDVMNYKEDDRKYIELMKACLEPLNETTQAHVVQNAYATVGMEYEAEKIKEHYPVVQEALRKFISEEVIQPLILPLIEIAKGMKSTPFQGPVIRGMNPEVLSERLQGTVTCEMILDKLSFSEGTPLQKQGWLKRWIQNASDEKVKQFLFALTGASSLGQKPLSIQKSASGSFFFHTCSNAVDIPWNLITSEKMLASNLEASISGVQRYSAQ